MNVKCNCIVCRTKNPSKYDENYMCPNMIKRNALMKFKDIDLKTDFSSTVPSVFIGHHGYPLVNVGFLTPPKKEEESWLYDAPRNWASQNYNIENVINLRSGLVNSRFKADVKKNSGGGFGKKFLDAAQEASIATKPVDVEVSIQDKPKINTNFDQYLAPTGPNAFIKNVEITSNVNTNKQVDKRVSDTDMLSNDAVNELFQLGFDESFLTRLLSMGNLGLESKRKLVPTRWAITAIDDNIGKKKIDDLKDFEMLQPCLFFGGYLGNFYIIMFFEDNWQYELFETLASDEAISGSISRNINDNMFRWATDFESYDGRSDYASNTAGGYYAARLPIIEWLQKEKKQASVLALRFVTDDYSCPLGVWVVREAVRKALNGKMHSFETKEQMLSYAKFIANKRFRYNLDNVLKDSKIYTGIRQQVKLSSYFK